MLGAAGAVVIMLVAWQLFRPPTENERAAGVAMGDPSIVQLGRAGAWLFYGFVTLGVGFVVLLAGFGIRWHTARRRAKLLGWKCCPCCQYELVIHPAVEAPENPLPITCPECGMQSTRKQIRKHWMADEPV